jgi:hypothetical protein
VWAQHLGLEVEAIYDANTLLPTGTSMGQSVCVLRKP